MKARADAAGELEVAGTFEDLTEIGSTQDDIDRQLSNVPMTSTSGCSITSVRPGTPLAGDDLRDQIWLPSRLAPTSMTPPAGFTRTG